MNLIDDVRFLLHITRSHGIIRRYFVVNGFDGALTMLGLTMGFYAGGGVAPEVAVSACLGASIALAMSGLSSAYISEAAERRKGLRELEQAMMTEMRDTAHGRGARFVPVMIALVNGLSPLVISLVIVLPLWLATFGVVLPLEPLESAIVTAFGAIFLLGAFLGRISGVLWFWMGLRAALIALITSVLILLIEP